MNQPSLRRRLALPVLGGLSLVSLTWLACSKEEAKPSYVDGAGLGGSDGNTAKGGGSGASGKGSGATGGNAAGGQPAGGGTAGGAGGSATAGGAGAAGAPPPEPFEEDAGMPPQPPDAGPPACDPGTSFGSPTTLVASPKGRLAAVSPDGLVLVWTKAGGGGSSGGAGGAAGGTAGSSGSNAGASGAGGAPEEGNLIYYAERATLGSTFPAPRTLSVPVNFQGTRPALSPDGKTLVVPRKDGKTFGLLRRAARSEAFTGTPNEQPFGTIALGAQMASLLLLDPVYSVDGGTLVFTKLGPAGGQIATCAEKADSTFSEQPPLTTFGANDSLVPTGLSSDGRTLFVYAETARVARALIRPAAGFAFDQTRVLGDRPFAQIDAACETLFYSTAADGDGEIVSAKKQ